jgi:ABC-type uncharacterized transport system permease subunit
MLLTSVFILVPLVVLVVYSFSGSRYATVWGGFSTQWYVRLADNVELREALWITLKLGGLSTLLATVLGLLIAVPGFLGAERVLELMGAEAGVLAVGTGYAQIMIASNVADSNLPLWRTQPPGPCSRSCWPTPPRRPMARSRWPRSAAGR